MNKRLFIDLARKGWETLDYAQGDFYPEWNTLAEPQPSQACAMGAAAYAAGMYQSVGAFIDRNGLKEVATIIYILSDAAGSKQAAIDALEEKL